MARRATPVERQRRESPLETLVTAFGQLTIECADRASASLRLSGQADDAEIATVLRAGLSAQATSLSTGVTELLRGIPEQQRELLGTRTMSSGGLELVRAAGATVTREAAFRVGIIDALEPIKKIIREILGLLGIELPKWLIKLLDFIDNILKTLFGLFGREAATRAERAQNGMYRHLREIYKTEAASMARYGGVARAAEDESE